MNAREKSVRGTIATLITLASVVAVVGCGNSVEPVSDGQLTVSWEISPRGCEGADVDTVQVDLSYEKGTRTETFDCQRDSGSIEHLRPANYKIRVIGIDSRGRATFEAGPKEVTVRGGGETMGPHMRLTARPAELEVAWRFGNGLVCGANEISKVELGVYDSDDYKVLGRTFACTEGTASIEEVPPGNYLVELRARADDEDEMFSGFSRVDATRGSNSEVEVVLEEVGD